MTSPPPGRALADIEPAVRSAALAALARAGGLDLADVVAALDDSSPGGPAAGVRDGRRRRRSPVRRHRCWRRLEDPDATVVEVAAWALGELSEVTALPPGAVAALSRVASTHADALAREAAVAALGAIGDPARTGGHPDRDEGQTGRPAPGRPRPRRRSTVPEVDEALERAATDRDWQVRQAAQLVGGDPGPT